MRGAPNLRLVIDNIQHALKPKATRSARENKLVVWQGFSGHKLTPLFATAPH